MNSGARPVTVEEEVGQGLINVYGRPNAIKRLASHLHIAAWLEFSLKKRLEGYRMGAVLASGPFVFNRYPGGEANGIMFGQIHRLLEEVLKIGLTEAIAKIHKTQSL